MVGYGWFSRLLTLSVLLIYLYLLSVPINLATADLGRHIRNGEQVLSGNFNVLYRNYYSYTNPDFPFVNHHWLGGIVFYLVTGLAGFSGVHLLFISGSLISFLIFFTIAKKYSNIYISSLLAILIIPVIAYRDEVRPEVFSYLFISAFYLILKNFTLQLKRKWLWLLPLIQLLWVNTHIYFFAGFFIVGVFWLVQLIFWSRKKTASEFSILRDLTYTGFACLAVSLFNPYFYNGLIYPLNIFGNYGYKVLENQSVFFLEKVIPVPTIVYFKIVLTLLVLSWIYKFFRFFRYREAMSWVDLFFSAVFSVLALLQIRNFTLFGLFALVALSQNLASVKFDYPKYLIIPCLGVLMIFVLVVSPSYWEGRKFGLGIAPGIDRAGDFFVNEKIKGPVFNNYDIGGYLIYYLYPGEKVFVDNRPEGYPAEFFTKTYVPMQEDDGVWKKKDEEYKFNAIFFYRQDLTPWAQTFLVSRVKDPDWAPVFVDNYNIIFLKRNEQNSELIKKYELPKGIFTIQE